MEILFLMILFALNGFFALSEIALVSSKRSRLEQMRIKGSKGAKTALHLLDDSESFLSAIQVGITLIGIITGVYGGMNLAHDITPFFEQFEPIRIYAGEISLTIALSHPEKTAQQVAPVIYYFSRLLYPFVKMLSVSTSVINKLIGVKKHPEQLTEAELRQMIKIASKEGVIEKEQNSIHENVFYFSDKKAQHIMTPRTDLEWIDINRSPEEINSYIGKIQHSKVICCKDNMDNFQGVLYLRDYYRALSENKEILISELIVDPIIITERTAARKVLNLLRQKESHVCFVVNEYGGFEGIITLYDIMENLVGEIPEEGEIFEPDVYIREDKSVLINGDAPVETLANIIEDFTIDFSEIDYSTVAGFVLDQINRIPKTGDRLQYLNYSIEIVDMDGNRIDKLLISKLGEQQPK